MAEGMDETTLHGDPPIPLILRRSGRARRMSLRVSRLDGRVTLSVPVSADTAAALRFARSQEAWLRRVLCECRAPVAPTAGMRFPLEGTERVLVLGSERRARITAKAIALPPERPGPALAAVLKAAARTAGEAAVARHAASLGRSVGRLTFRDTRSRWGSCSTRGDVMLSWRLIMAPPEVLDYVAAHEVAHLERMDHSPAFWRVVQWLCPAYAGPKEWLRRNGPALHGWHFG